MITVLFSCHDCGLKTSKAFVRDRQHDEDIAKWMEEVTVSIGDAHSLASPGCTGRHADVLIPISEGKRIGDRK